MNQLLGDLNDIYTLVYLDDTLIFSYTNEKYWKHIRMVFARIAKFNYYVKCKKCELFSKKVEFLGHTVSTAGVGIVKAKIDAIKQWPNQHASRIYTVFKGKQIIIGSLLRV